MRPLFLSDQKRMYALFMQTVAGTVIDLARDRRYRGATPGILMVLHTWTGQLHYHPYVHLLVTGGGISDDGQSWSEPFGPFLVPVKALSKLIAARFRDALKKARPDAFGHLPRKSRGAPSASIMAEPRRPSRITWLGTRSASRSPTLGSSPWTIPMILIDDQHPFRRPTPFDCPTSQVVLQSRRFTMLEHLLRSGLSHINHRQPILMLGLNLGGHQGRGACKACLGTNCGSRFSGDHDPPPVPSTAEAGVGLRFG